MTTHTRKPEPQCTSWFCAAMAGAAWLPGIVAAQSAVEKFDIVGCCIPPAIKLSVARFREMAECGLTASRFPSKVNALKPSWHRQGCSS